MSREYAFIAVGICTYFTVFWNFRDERVQKCGAFLAVCQRFPRTPGLDLENPGKYWGSRCLSMLKPFSEFSQSESRTASSPPASPSLLDHPNHGCALRAQAPPPEFFLILCSSSNSTQFRFQGPSCSAHLPNPANVAALRMEPGLELRLKGTAGHGWWVGGAVQRQV